MDNQATQNLTLIFQLNTILCRSRELYTYLLNYLINYLITYLITYVIN